MRNDQAEPSLSDLDGGEIHVWQAHLEHPGLERGLPLDVLSPDERARAQRFRFDSDRRRFATCRALLRHSLGRYLAIAPQELAFVYGPHGKPALADAEKVADLQFNVAHSGPLAVIGFAIGHALGVDLESVRPLPDLDGIVSRYFSPAERQALDRLPPIRRLRAFYFAWTRKEAILKTLGGGLSIPLSAFSVSVDPGEPAVVRETDPGLGPVKAWSLRSFEPFPDTAAALAIRGNPVSESSTPLRMRQWEASRLCK